MDANKRTRILATVGIVVILGALVFAGFRMFGSLQLRIAPWLDGTRTELPESERTPGSSGGRVELPQTPDLAEFSRITAEGGWRVIVTPGDHSVTVTVDERIADDVRVTSRGGELRLSVAPGFRSVASNLEARIVVPSLERLEIAGGAEVTLRDLTLGRLQIDVDGAASVKGLDSDIQELEVDAAGATNIDFLASRVVSARVEMDGASNVKLTMAGGELTGVLRGVGNVTYGGEVSRETVRIEGLGNIRER